MTSRSDNDPGLTPEQAEAYTGLSYKTLKKRGVERVLIGGKAGTRSARWIYRRSVLNRLLDSYDDGIWIADLVPVEDPRLVAGTVAAALGLDPAAGSDPLRILITRLAPSFPGTWFVGCGAAIPFAAGALPRAPQWMQRTGLEWTFRLASEPRRLFSRYLVHDLPFALTLLAASAADRLRHRREDPPA